MAQSKNLNKTNLKPLVQSFFVDDKLQKENLRIYLFNLFNKIHEQVDYYLKNPQYSSVWTKVSDMCVMNNNENCQIASQRIQSFHTLIDSWLNESLATPEKFEFFILSKAVEISSGDKDKDYYHAMLVRHDQLLAASVVFQDILDCIIECTALPPQKIPSVKCFKTLGEKDIDKRIFETAEAFYKIRVEMGKLGIK